MQIEFQKKRDGTSILRCLRDDGTVTWQKRAQGFFDFHDLSHYAVEATLSLRFGFYGILAAGWDIGDFGTPWPRGKLPEAWAPDASLAENLAGAFDRERDGSMAVVAEEFNAYYMDLCAEAGIPSVHQVTPDEIAAIRIFRAELFDRWRTLPAGETLSLTFPLLVSPTGC